MTILATILGVVFMLAGGMKVAQSKEKLSSNMAWVEDFTAQQVQLIGAAEVLGGLGLIVSRFLFDIDFLTPIAGLCLAILMGGAVYTHYRRGETTAIAPAAVLGVLALIVFFGLI